MAYTVTSKSATLVKNVGIIHKPKDYVGVAALSSNTVTVSIPGAQRIVAAFIAVQGTTTTAYVSATSANTFTITTTGGSGSENVMWQAYVE